MTSLLDLFDPPKPPKPENVSRVHEFFGKQIPPVNANRLTLSEREQRERERKKRRSWKHSSAVDLTTRRKA